jgi:hypothetical protein
MDKRGARNGQTGREWEMEERNWPLVAMGHIIYCVILMPAIMS